MSFSLADLRASCAAPLPHPGPDELQLFLDQVATWVLDRHVHLPQSAIGAQGSPTQMEDLLDEPPPQEGQGFPAVFEQMKDRVAPHAYQVGHPRFLAFIPGAPTFLSILGDWLCAGTNFFAGVWMEASGPAQVELVVLSWFRQILGLSSSTQGILTSGGSEATLTALVVARDQIPPAERPRAALFVSQQRHWSVDRAAHIIGIRPEQIVALPCDSRLRLQGMALDQAIQDSLARGLLPWAVVASAGTTNTGAIDDIPSLAEVCARHRLWLHVDAAYGWSAALTPEGKSQLAGIDQADSITLDPHKWLAQTFDAGCVLVREGGLLERSFAMRPEYMQDVEPEQDVVSFADRGIALTRRFRALKIWLSVKALGVSWYRHLIEHCCNLALLMEALLRQHPQIEIVSPPQLSILCFRHLPAWSRSIPVGHRAPHEEEAISAHNIALAEAVRATGKAFLTTTRLRGQAVLRCCFVSWRTTTEDVEQVISLLLQLAPTVE